jgi:hypothetical protein
MIGAWLWRHLQQSVNVWDCTLGPSPAVYTWDGRRCGEQVTNKNVFKHYHHPSDVKGQVLVCSADNERIIFAFHGACHYIDPHDFFAKLTVSQNYTSQERISSSSFILQYFFLYLPYFIHLFLFIPLLSSLNLSLYIYQSPTAPSLFQTSTYQPIHSFVNLFVDLILLSDFPSFTFSLHCYFCIYFSFLFVSSSFPLYTVHTVTHSPTQLPTHSWHNEALLQSLLFYAFFASTLPANLHHFLIYCLSFRV